MKVIEGLKLNKFVYVSIPTRREMFERMRGKLSAKEYAPLEDGDFSDPVNVYDTMNKVELNEAARRVADARARAESSTAKP